MGEKLGLPKDGKTTFMEAYLQRIRALPGREQFRTGISLWAPLGEPSKLPQSGSSEARIILFVSFPYFGGSGKEITLGPKSESVKLLDFKRLGAGSPSGKAVASEEEERGGIGKPLVHQARYMVFDNCKLCSLAYP